MTHTTSGPPVNISILILIRCPRLKKEKSGILNSGYDDGVTFLSCRYWIASWVKQKESFKQIIYERLYKSLKGALGKPGLVCCRSNCLFYTTLRGWQHEGWKLYCRLIFRFVHDLTSFRKMINISQIQLLRVTFQETNYWRGLGSGTSFPQTLTDRSVILLK